MSEVPRSTMVICQSCGTANEIDEEICERCRQRLWIASGSFSQLEGLDLETDDSQSLEEHLLERVSLLEEAVKRTADSLRQVLGVVRKQEQGLLLQESAVSALGQVLTANDLVSPDEWSAVAQAHRAERLVAIEKRERFVALRERIDALAHGRRREEFLTHVALADEGLRALDVDAAMTSLERALQIDRGNYELAQFLGEIHFGGGRPALAQKLFEQVLEERPDHYEGLVYAGVLCHQHGDIERADEHLTQAVELHPDRFLSQFCRGAVLAAHGRSAEAVVPLSRAVELDAAPQALYLLGTCLYEQGRLTPAIRSLERAVRRDPQFEEAFHLLGLAYLDRRWPRKALGAFREALRLNPKKLRYHQLVTQLGERSGSIPLTPQARLSVQRGLTALASERHEEAIEAFREAIQCDGEQPTLLLYYAVACLYLGRTDESRLITQRVLKLDCGDLLVATAYATLIDALRSQGNYLEGNRLGQQLLEESNSDLAKTVAYYEMAWNLAETEEDLGQALEFAQRSLELSPEELRPYPLAAMGWIHYKRGELPQAVDCLVRSTALEPSSTTLTHLGMALLASGEDGRARDALAEARALRGPSGVLEVRMMECVRDSARLVRRAERRGAARARDE